MKTRNGIPLLIVIGAVGMAGYFVVRAGNIDHENGGSVTGAKRMVEKNRMIQTIEHAIERKGSENPFVKHVGRSVRYTDEAEFMDWAEDLSRNDYEKQQRMLDLKHIHRAEVVRSDVLSYQSEKISSEAIPFVIDLPSFDGGVEQVKVTHLSLQGPESGAMWGVLVGDSQASAVIGFHNGEMTARVDKDGSLLFIDALEDEVVILREVDEARVASDKKCGCSLHGHHTTLD
ncbi:hypothetical protein [Rubritalea tangerina]|uniref:Uncharacterized protein n=1 Tax=Rubritalea tangerina TaxID=430798 RepID=A0ABW4ZFE1_9BACT